MEEQKPKRLLKKKFLLDDMFEKYMTNMGLDKRKILPFQIKEMRKAFYGAIGMFLMVQEEIVGLKATEEEMADIIDDMMAQCEQFFADQMLSQN